MIAALIASGRCTLNELRTVYSLEDAWNIWEADYIPKYNAYKAHERQRELSRLKREILVR